MNLARQTLLAGFRGPEKGEPGLSGLPVLILPETSRAAHSRVARAFRASLKLISFAPDVPPVLAARGAVRVFPRARTALHVSQCSRAAAAQTCYWVGGRFVRVGAWIDPSKEEGKS